MSDRHDGFFIGWSSGLPQGLRGFLAAVSVALLCGAALLGLVLSASIDDPGGGDWVGGEATLRGTIAGRPYPLLYLPASSRHPAGHAVLLAGVGKNGAEVDPALVGHMVEATGAMLKRGSIDMMQVGDDPGLREVAEASVLPAAVQVGRWRLVGEICDGKCWTGAMRPGSGIAHKACANLCVIGGLPPVLVTTAPVAGSTFLLLAGADGGPMPDALRPLIGLRISLDGEIERRGDLLVLRVAPASVHKL
jgi:hypothetical protein